MALLSCNNAAFAYDGRKVVSNLNFTVEPGDYLCIVGENGAGKSTLVKGLLGFIKPCGGSVTMGSGLRENEIGYLPQQTDVQRDFPARWCCPPALTASACVPSIQRTTGSGPRP